jgi:hypothetical protein
MKQRIVACAKKIYDLPRRATKSHVAFLILLVGTMTAYSIAVPRAIAGPGQPFGGQIYNIFPCTCSGNVEVFFNDLTISPPIPPGIPLLYQPGVTITCPYYNQTLIGSYILGTWVPGGQCLTGSLCVPSFPPPAGTMYIVGSSGGVGANGTGCVQ